MYIRILGSDRVISRSWWPPWDDPTAGPLCLCRFGHLDTSPVSLRAGPAGLVDDNLFFGASSLLSGLPKKELKGRGSTAAASPPCLGLAVLTASGTLQGHMYIIHDYVYIYIYI